MATNTNYSAKYRSDNIYSAAISNRLKPVLVDLISQTQKGF